MKQKILISLAPALLVAALVAGVGAPSAGAAACTEFVLCNNSNEKLRDDFTEPPAETEGEPEPGVKGKVKGGFGTSGLAVNTAGKLRFSAELLGLRATNENPKGYAFFGVKLDSNESTSTTACHKASGWVEFVDVQDASPSAVYSGEAPFKPAAPARGGLGPWRISANSDNTGCPEAERGKVTVSNVSLFFPGLTGAPTAVGSFTGKWVQPGSCPGGSGGVKLDVKQPGITLSNGATKPELDNGTANTNAFVCFVSANNYLFPTTAPTWEPFTGNVWKD